MDDRGKLRLAAAQMGTLGVPAGPGRTPGLTFKACRQKFLEPARLVI